ncbi:MAG: M81 family metallopeptidase [Arcanobacterium sp.]|nr:M81 family metallopeptidase [Arcanobacterium sp.]
MRIGICGIHIESSTFTPYFSKESDFSVTRGEELLARYPFLTEQPVPGAAQVPAHLAGIDGDADGHRDWTDGIEWVPILHARALPGGAVVRETYEAWKSEICERLTDCGELDALFFDIHGAMSTPGLDDAEGDLISAIREVIGSEVLVGGCMDLHGNISRTLFSLTDMLTCYRMAPHEDAWVTRERAARTLTERVKSGLGKPKKVLARVPILLPGEKTSTRMEPAKSLYDRIAEFDHTEGIIDGGFWIGFAWADQPRCCAAIAAYGDDAKVLEEQVGSIANELWERRHEFEFVAPTANFDVALDAALASEVGPFFISDSGDNPGAGGADDVTVALTEVLSRSEIVSGEKTAIVASIFDPETVAQADTAGVGATITANVGGKIDSREPGTVTADFEVVHLFDDPMGLRTAVLRKGGLSLIVTARRNQYTTKDQFERTGLNPEETDIVIVKIGYLEPYLFDIQKDWILALTPGGVDQDLLRLGHSAIERPMFPFDDPAEVEIPLITE